MRPLFRLSIATVALLLPWTLRADDDLPILEEPPPGYEPPPIADSSCWLNPGPLAAPAPATNTQQALGAQPPAPPLAGELAAPPQRDRPATQAVDLGLPLTLAACPDDLLRETALGLDCNWARCYLFVRNKIRFAPGRGLSRGPVRTLLEREGSAGDQAFLLLALLRASGYAGTTVRYAAQGGFSVPLGGAPDGYDAASWLGCDAGGGVAQTREAVSRLLSRAGIAHTCADGASLESSSIRPEHFWVRLTLDGQAFDLDPAFKPHRVTRARESLLDDMGYSRTNLLALARGGTGATCVSNLSHTAVFAEMDRLTANLVQTWNAAGPQQGVQPFIGRDEVVEQDVEQDASTFHGSAGAGTDFLAKTAGEINAMRSVVKIDCAGFSRSVWLDEVGPRRLWLSFSPSSGYDFPRAVLHVEEEPLAEEAHGSQVQDLNLYIRVTTASGISLPLQTYGLARSTANVYALVVGLDGGCGDGLRRHAQAALERAASSAADASDPFVRASALHAVGQQWLAQTAMVRGLLDRIGGTRTYSHYRVGLAGQAGSPFVDLKNCAYFSSDTQLRLAPSSLFESALEHAVLDQAGGTNRPAVSTVRLVYLANKYRLPVYFATSGNWSNVSGALKNHDVAGLASLVGKGLRLLLPQNGYLTLKQWHGWGYMCFGPSDVGYSTGMMIGGGLAGGFASTPFDLTGAEINNQYAPSLTLPNAVSPTYTLSDPVDARDGAFYLDRRDLALAAPLPLDLTRHYDSRLRNLDGPVGRGWTHGLQGDAGVRADPDAAFGGSSPAACAASAAACAAVADLFDAGVDDAGRAGECAKNLTVACLVVQWWSDLLVTGSASAQSGGRSLAFARAPDGSYSPAPGATAALARSNTTWHVLGERLGPARYFNPRGKLDRVVDPAGNWTRLYYNAQTNLVAATNAFGAALAFTWDGGRVSRVTDSAGRFTRYAYDRAGCLTSVTDAAGAVWRYAYDGDGGLVSETDPGGAVTVLNAYNALGQVTNQLSAGGHRSTFAYADGARTVQRDPLGGTAVSEFDDAGRLTRAEDPRGGVSLAFYDAQGQAVTNVDALGRMTVREYDASNRLTRVTEAANTPDARTTRFAYDSRHRLVAVTNALGRVTRTAYDDRHLPVLTVAPDGTAVTNAYDARGLPVLSRALDASGRALSETATAYDARGLAVSVSSADAGTVRYGYDSAGGLTGFTNALGRGTRIWYDKRGLPTNAVDALGGRTVRTYTPAGRPATVTDPLGRVTRTTWTPAGQPAAVFYADGGVTTNEYDAADRLVASTDPRGGRVTLGLDLLGRATNRCGQAWSEQTSYDAVGLATARVDAVSGRTVTEYDRLDRPVASTDPLGRTRAVVYDALGSPVSSTDPRGRTTAYACDLAGRRVRTVHPSGRAESDAYDALGRLAAFTNAEGRVFRMSYDAQGRLTAATNAAGEQVVRNFYDAAGNLTNSVDAASRRAVYRYDALDRCTNTAYADGTADAFIYDACGNLLAAARGTTTNLFAYDCLDRLTSAVLRAEIALFSVAEYRVGYAYDQGGLVTNVVYPGGGAVRYAYDSDGRLVNVTDWAGRTWAFGRDAAGRLTSLDYPNGVTGSWTYDAGHAVSGWSYGNGTPFAGRAVTRDAAGLKTEERVTAGLFPNPRRPRRAANTYDAADRLVSAQVEDGTNACTETYAYDGCGALTNRQSGADVRRYAYTPDGRLLSFEQANFHAGIGYDALGNIVVTAKPHVQGGCTVWSTDHADPLKRPLANSDGRRFIWGGGMLLAVVEADGTVHYAHSDEQGSIVALTDASGAVTDQWCYGPYGEDWGRTGTSTIPFRWLGSHGVLAAGSIQCPAPSLYNGAFESLYVTRHRAYDAALGRFLSADPLGLGGGPNLYAYCLGNPLAYIDPLGLCAESYGFGFNDYSRDVGQMLLGYGDAIGGTVEGLYNTVAHPVNTAHNLWSAVSNPIQTVQNIGSSIADSWTSGYRGMGSVVGGTLITAATIAAPYASSGKVLAGTGSAAKNTTALDWSIASKAGETRAAHVTAQHGALNLQKPVQGVFYGNPVSTLDDAWAIAQQQGIKPITSGGADIYVIPVPTLDMQAATLDRGKT